MKLYGEIIHPHGVRYHQYVDDSELYISAHGELSDAAITPSVPEGYGGLNGNHRLKLNPAKTEWLWVRNSSALGEIPSFWCWRGCTAPQFDPVYNIGVLQLEEQMALWARRVQL